MTDTITAPAMDMPVESRPITQGHEIGEGVMHGPYKPLDEKGDTTPDEKAVVQGMHQLTEHKYAANDALMDGHIAAEAHKTLRDEREVALNGLTTAMKSAKLKKSVNSRQ